MLRNWLISTLVLLCMVSIPASLYAKGKTTRITIQGANLKTPIEITDAATLANFNVWTGPGTSSNESQGLIVNWSQGKIPPPPKGLPLYEVFFYADFGGPQEKLVYVVSYEFDPSTGHGYVYLPGKKDKWWSLNVGSILHSLEGNWFNAWSVWDKVASPLIDKAKATP